MAKNTSRKSRTGMAPVTAGAILAVVLIAITYFGFTKHIPFTHGYRLQAVFESSNSLRPGSPVRIAGVNVGKVKKVERAGSSDAAVVTMELDNKALPIHKDATLKIRPRIFLEGNFFVDLKPGTPSSPTLSDNDRIPMTQTSRPVQLDEVLTSLQSDARVDLQDVLINYGQSLKHVPTAAENADQDRAVKGEDGAKALNQAFNYSGPALRNTSIVNEALLGTQPGDLPKLIKSFAVVAGALDRNEDALKGLIVNFNVTTAAFASESGNLQATIRLLAPTLRNANRAFTSLNAAFPPTRAFAREILPGVRETPATIDVSYPWVAQTRKLLGPNELGGLAKVAQPTTAALAKLTDDSIALLPAGRQVQPLPDRRDPSHRGHQDQRRPAHHGRRELQGVLVHDGRARQRGPELRRQRELREVPGGRRQPDRVDGQDLDGRRRAVRKRGRQADRHPAEVPGQAAPLQADRRVRDPEDPEPQRSGDRRRRVDGAHPGARHRSA